MRYGFFDNANREYVIDRVDVPVSWQPVGKPKEHYSCRHGLSCSKYHCDYGSTIAVLIVVLDVELSNVANRVFKTTEDD